MNNRNLPLPPLPSAEAQAARHEPSVNNTREEDGECQPVPVCRFKSKSECMVTKAKRSKGSFPSPDAMLSPQGGEAIMEDIYICSESECGKHAHMVCYKQMLSRNQFVSELGPNDTSLPFACSIRCMKKLLKDKPKDKSSDHKNGKFWDNDGSDTTPSSMEVLLQWLTDQRNAAKYFGAKDSLSDNIGFSAEDGVTKQGLCTEISQIIFQNNGKCTN